MRTNEQCPERLIPDELLANIDIPRTERGHVVVIRRIVGVLLLVHLLHLSRCWVLNMYCLFCVSDA